MAAKPIINDKTENCASNAQHVDYVILNQSFTIDTINNYTASDSFGTSYWLTLNNRVSISFNLMTDSSYYINGVFIDEGGSILIEKPFSFGNYSLKGDTIILIDEIFGYKFSALYDVLEAPLNFKSIRFIDSKFIFDSLTFKEFRVIPKYYYDKIHIEMAMHKNDSKILKNKFDSLSCQTKSLNFEPVSYYRKFFNIKN